MSSTAIPRRAARSTKHPSPGTKGAASAPARWSLWLLGAGTWLFVAVSLLSFNAADAPSHTVAVHNDVTQNLGGGLGAFIAYWIQYLIGFGSWIILGGAAIWLFASATGRTFEHRVLRCIGMLLAGLAVSGFNALWFPASGAIAGSPAGLVAHASVDWLDGRIGMFGTFLVLLVAFLIGLIVALDQLILSLPGRLFNLVSRFEFRMPRPDLQGLLAGPRRLAIRGRSHEEEDYEYEYEDEEEYEDEGVEDAWDEDEEVEEEEDEPARAPMKSKKELRNKIAKLPLRIGSRNRKQPKDEDLQRDESYEGYKFPPLELLADPESNFTEKAEASVRRQAELLEQALETYGIEGEVEGIDAGPTVTLYSVQLAPGTKVNSLSRIANDVARSLSVQNIRIVPNMAGKTTVGIEVPNLVRETVAMKELIASGQDQGMILPMFMGKDSSGEPLVLDLVRMPHVLIAGTTGSGKSVCINSIIMSWLYMKRPDDVKLILVDPKMVELGQFADIPHLACPVVTEMGKAAAILEWAVGKMEERYTLFQEAGVRDIASYNALTEEEKAEIFDIQNEIEKAKVPQKLNYIVFIIDELADLMLTNKEVEQSIVRIAQKARAVGIHLVLATQRPQANVVTGLIKSNMPCRVSFRVASSMDSRIVLDNKGAELLLGNGDMMFVTPANPNPQRAQGTFVSDRESRKVVRFLKDVAKPSFERSLIQVRNVDTGRDGDGPTEFDPLFDDAAKILIESGRGSVSLIQRRLAIGYSRASRLVDQMAQVGIIGEHVGSKAREVLVTLEEWEKMKSMMEEEEFEEPYHVDEDPDCLDEPAPEEFAGEYLD